MKLPQIGGRLPRWLERGEIQWRAFDLAHAASHATDRVRFTRVKRAVLRLAPQAEFGRVAAEMASLWPDGGRRPMERAS